MGGAYLKMMVMMVVVVVVILINSYASAAASSSATVAEECSSSLGTVSSCVPYVTGMTQTLSSECCIATKKLYADQEVCLCYLVEQAYTNPSQAGGSIDMGKLLGLPSSCHIQGANASQCVGLLGLTPSSPGAAVFLSPNSSTPSTPSTPSTASSPATTASPPPPNEAFGLRALSMDCITVLAIGFFLCAFPVGFLQAM